MNIKDRNLVVITPKVGTVGGITVGFPDHMKPQALLWIYHTTDVSVNSAARIVEEATNKKGSFVFAAEMSSKL